jgi:hypothetical protein
LDFTAPREASIGFAALYYERGEQEWVTEA